MYIDPVEYKIAENFLTGFRIGYFSAIDIFDYEPWWESQAERGWGRGPAGPIPKMIEKDMSNEQIIDELIEIEIVALKKYKLKYSDEFEK